MSKGELIFLAMGGSVLSILAVAMVLVFALIMHTQTRIGRYFVPLMLALCALGMTLGVVLSGRDVRFAAFAVDSMNAEPGGATWPNRAVTFLILGLSLSIMVGRIFDSLKMSGSRRIFGPEKPLAVVFIAYFVATNVIPAFMGEKPAFIHNQYYAFPLFLVAIISATKDLELVIEWAKMALHMIMVASLIALAVAPTWHCSPATAAGFPGSTCGCGGWARIRTASALWRCSRCCSSMSSPPGFARCAWRWCCPPWWWWCWPSRRRPGSRPPSRPSASCCIDSAWTGRGGCAWEPPSCCCWSVQPSASR